MPYDLVIFAFGPHCPANAAGYSITPLAIRCENQSDCHRTAENLANALRPGYALPCQIWSVIGHVPVKLVQQFTVRPSPALETRPPP